MEMHDFSPPKRIDANEVNTKKRPNNTTIYSYLDTIVNSIPPSKDKQGSSFEDVLKKAYEDFPKLKMHAGLHLSEYKNATDLINELPVQLQDKWRLLRFYLWYQHGPSIFGAIFNLTQDKTTEETAFLSDLPDKLTDMVSELLQEDDDEDEEEDAIAGNITSESPTKRKYAHPPRINSEKKEFVTLAQGGQQWNRLTQNQTFVLEQRYLIDAPESLTAIAGQLRVSHESVAQTEKAGLRKLGFFGDRINLTRKQCQNIFQNAKEEKINSLTPKELELLRRFYGKDANHSLRSQPTGKSVSADLGTTEANVQMTRKNALHKLLHTKRPISIIGHGFSPTSEEIDFLRQTIPLKDRHTVASQLGISVRVLDRLKKQEGIKSSKSRNGRPRVLLSPEELEFIKANYQNKGLKELAKLTGYHYKIITRCLRDAGISIRKRGEKITSI